jgi:hypothetical protein
LPDKIRPDVKVKSSQIALRKKSIHNQMISKRETTIKQEDTISTNIAIRNISTEAQAKRTVTKKETVTSEQTFGAPPSDSLNSPIASEKHVDAVKITKPVIREEDEQPVMETIRVKKKGKKINNKRKSIEPPLTANPTKKKRGKLKNRINSDTEDA